MDYSPYDISFTAEGRRRVHAFSYILAYSRRQYVRLWRLRTSPPRSGNTCGPSNISMVCAPNGELAIRRIMARSLLWTGNGPNPCFC